MNYSDDQSDALENFRKYLGTSESYMSLTGPAGSGKSTIVKAMMDIASEDVFARPIVLTAPTHKASENLRQITGDSAKTIHSLLNAKIQRDYDTGDEYLVVNTRVINQKKFNGVLVVVDESSMVGAQLMAAIDKVSDKVNAKFLFIGDSHQLAPVGEAKSIVVDPVKCPWRLSELTTVHRQAFDSPVLALATDIRLGNKKLSDAETDLNQGVGVHVLNADEWREHLIENCKDTDRNNRSVTYTNNFTDRINKRVRSVAHDDENLPPYLSGEVMVSNSRVAHGENAIVENNEELTIEKVSEPDADGMIDIETDDGREFVVMGDFQARKAYLNNKAKAVKDGIGNWREFYEESDRIGDLRPIYSSTAHKSQGSTYADTYLNLKDLGKCRNPDEYRRLGYVALTRASNSVYITR